MKQILALVRANALADTPDFFTLEIDEKRLAVEGTSGILNISPSPGVPKNGSSELVGRAESLRGDLKCAGNIPL
jgi:hypothetical protein